ncbi:NPCBM/NEW2 domain-containing protein [Nocardioides sp. NPDC004968]|uniref:NPCBM/NEW2 domain-containing protein n=1 Tax=Nocardioides sp. NPDC004968 TaxID=3155894 RepID=UPI0033BB3C54
MRGETYVKSITFGQTFGEANWIDYNLGLKCQRFEVTVGVDDTAPPKSGARVAVWTDDVEHVIGQTALGKPLTAKLDVTGVLRLRLEAVSTVGDTNAEYGGDIVWGSPRSWCTS